MTTRKKHKLTFEVHNAIKALALVMPPMVRTNEVTGKPLQERFQEHCRGQDIPKEYRKMIRDFKLESFYFMTKVRDVAVNHELVLIDIYKNDGDNGIEDYLAIIQGHLDYEKIFKEKLQAKDTIWKKFLRVIKK